MHYISYGAESHLVLITREDRVIHSFLGAITNPRLKRFVPVSALTQDEDGRVSGFEQLGWSVQLERYQAVPAAADGAGAERQLPRRVTATRDDSRVRLVISEWRL